MNTAFAILTAFHSVTSLEVSLAASPMVVDARDRAIGYLANHDCTDGPSYAFITRNGYSGCVPVGTGQLGGRLGPPGSNVLIGDDLSFVSNDCSGQPLICATGPFTGGFLIRTRVGVVYAEHGALSESVDINSDIKFGTTEVCTPRGVPQHVQCVMANSFNASELGVATTRYMPPLHVETLEDEALEDVIFFDGFGPI